MRGPLASGRAMVASHHGGRVVVFHSEKQWAPPAKTLRTFCLARGHLERNTLSFVDLDANGRRHKRRPHGRVHTDMKLKGEP